MRRPVAGKPIGRVSIIDRVGIGGIEANPIVIGTDHHEGPDVLCFGKLTRDPSRGIAQLRDGTAQSHSNDWLQGDASAPPDRLHWEKTDRIHREAGIVYITRSGCLLGADVHPIIDSADLILKAAKG